jgi:hypothetical protein
MNIETIQTLWAIATNPMVQLGGTALLALALMLLSYAIRTQPKVTDVAQDLADLSEEIEPWVIEAEKTFMRGEARYSAVVNKAQAWLKEQGITGRRGRVVQKYLPALIEVAVKKADPKPVAKAS